MRLADDSNSTDCFKHYEAYAEGVTVGSPDETMDTIAWVLAKSAAEAADTLCNDHDVLEAKKILEAAGYCVELAF